MKKLSIVLATRNEEENIGRCLGAVAGISYEIIVFDEYSTDKTREIAESYGAKVYLERHHDNFHITKQKAIDKATGDWILQLDADEVITPKLAEEIKKVIEMTSEQIKKRRIPDLFVRHEKMLNMKAKSEELVAFFIPRKNIFLGKPLIRAGVYPDPAIRLIKKGKARLPGKSVHEIMEVDGKVSWLVNDMLHYDSPTLARYFNRLNRYTDLSASELKNKRVSLDALNMINYSLFKPLLVFLKLYVRHRGYIDGMRGFLWSVLSAMHYPISYFKYWEKNKK